MSASEAAAIRSIWWFTGGRERTVVVSWSKVETEFITGAFDPQESASMLTKAADRVASLEMPLGAVTTARTAYRPETLALKSVVRPLALESVAFPLVGCVAIDQATV